MRFSGRRLSLDKRKLPPYIYKINVATVIFFAVWFIICLPVWIAVGVIYGDSPATFIAMVAAVALFLIGFAILLPIDSKLRERLVTERAGELEKEFADMSLEEAEQILKSSRVINDIGFIGSDKDGVSGNNDFSEFVIPFENADISIFCNVCNTVIEIKAYIYDADGDNEIFLKFDSALFNFIDKRNLILYEDEPDFVYLKNDKKNFCRRAFGLKQK